jgi:hypothetical protein
MIIKRWLEKVSSIFLTPTAGRAIQFDHIVKDQGPATIVKLGREGPSFFEYDHHPKDGGEVWVSVTLTLSRAFHQLH